MGKKDEYVWEVSWVMKDASCNDSVTKRRYFVDKKDARDLYKIMGMIPDSHLEIKKVLLDEIQNKIPLKEYARLIWALNDIEMDKKFRNI